MVVGVRFKNNRYKIYDYFTDLPLKFGDLVVVPVDALARGNLAFLDTEYITVAQVVAVKDSSTKASAWVIQKIDTAAFVKRMEDKQVEDLLS